MQKSSTTKMSLIAAVAMLAPSAVASAAAGPAQPAGEFLFFVGRQSVGMSQFNNALINDYGWSGADSSLTSCTGLGMEVDVRFGQPSTHGFGFGFNFQIANLTKYWGYYSGYGSYTEYLYLSTMDGYAKYSGSIPVSPMFSINWGFSLGAGGLLSSDNHTRDYSIAYNEYYAYSPGMSFLYEIDLGPTLYLPGPQGFVLALRFGYRSFSFGPAIRWRSTSSYRTFTSGTLPYILDYSGPFFRLCLGFGNVGGKFGPRLGAGGVRKGRALENQSQPAPPPRPY